MSLIDHLQARIPVRVRVGGINRAPSPLLATVTPWLSIMLASVLAATPLIASAPIMPPLGLMLLLAWYQIRPGLLPVWAGLPLGAFDDLFSGQPFGSAILLWSLAVMALVVIEARFPWRNFLLDWLVAAAMLLAALVAMLGLANATGGASPLLAILPQTAITLLLYPLTGRLAGALDRLRLIPIVDLG